MDEVKYFCHHKEDDKFAAAVLDKAETWERHLEESNIYHMQSNVYTETYYAHKTASEIVEGGEKGEIKFFNKNYFAHFKTGVRNMITGRPMGFVPRTSKNESEAMQEVTLARILLENEYESNGEEERNAEAVDDSLSTGAAFESILWNPDDGPLMEDGTPLGGIRYQLHMDCDVIRDIGKKDLYKNSWMLIREWHNKFEFGERYRNSKERPELYKKILDQGKSKFKNTGENLTALQIKSYKKGDDDTIPVYRFFHCRNKLMPNGMRAILLEDGTVVQRQDDLIYEDIPVAILRTMPWRGYNHGWTPFYDLVTLQSNLRMCTSAVATNQEAGAINFYWTDTSESDIDIEQVRGRAFVKGKGNPPVPISLTSTAAEVFNSIQMLINDMSVFSAFSPAQAGDIESGASGKAMQISIGQSQEYHQALDKSFTMFNEHKAMLIIENFRLFATVERTVEQVGETKRSEVKTFKNTDLADVESIAIERGPGFMAQVGERVKFGQFLLQAGIITPREFMTVVSTGNTDFLTEKDSKEDSLIKKENEMILLGEVPPVAPTDNDVTHMKKHKDSMCDMDARTNPTILNAYKAHMMEHYENIQAKAQDPLMMAVFNGEPLPPPMPMGVNPNSIGLPAPAGPPLPPGPVPIPEMPPMPPA